MRFRAAVIMISIWGCVCVDAASAEDRKRPAQCKLVVKGKTYIDGQCMFRAGQGGSFQISGKDYFAYVHVSGGNGEASWNEDPKSTHAQTPLGTVTRKGACWTNANAQICATNISSAVARANMPNGEIIYPAVPGASSTCVIALNDEWTENAQLVLVGKCPGDASAHRFARADGMITISRAPGLCAGISRDKNRARVVLQKCSEIGTRWDTAATSVTAAAIRSEANECWIIPGIDKEITKWPIAIEAVRCDDTSAQHNDFYFEK